MSQYPDVGPQLWAAAEAGARPMQLLVDAIDGLDNEAALQAIMQILSQEQNPTRENPQIWRVRTDHIVLLMK